MPGQFDKEKPPTFLQRARPWLWGFTFALIFCLDAVELGLVSDVVNHHSNDVNDYPGQQFKNTIGLVLFSSIATLLYIVGHYWAGPRMSFFWTFVFAVFWGTCAGELNNVGFSLIDCGKPASNFPPRYGPWLGWCHRLVAMQGVAWALWGIFMFKLVAMFIENCELRPKRNVKHFYQVV